MNKHKVAIIGSGPAGYAAALYTSRANLETTLLAGEEPGGQLMKTSEVENYPGYSQGILGPKLMSEMMEQVKRFGTEIIWETVTKLERLEKEGGVEFVLTTNGGSSYQAEAVILALGATPRLLYVGEEKYFGKGFSTCAVCDAPFYKDKTVYVVGGGDAAVEDATALAKFARSVTMLVRGDKLRASKIMQERVKRSEKIKILYNTELVAVEGERVEAITVKDRESGVVSRHKTEGLFMAIGHLPATEFLKGSGVARDERGYIKNGLTYPLHKVENESYWTAHHPTMTTVKGIFAAGDCVDFRYRQAATASGMGVMAALDAERYLEER